MGYSLFTLGWMCRMKGVRIRWCPSVADVMIYNLVYITAVVMEWSLLIRSWNVIVR